MPAKRALHLDNKDSHEPVQSAAQSDIPGTGSLPAGQTTSKQIIQHRDIEKLHTLTSKLEKSGGAFIKARKCLEEIAAEGNTELRSFLAKGSADLNTELARNRQLTSRAELQLKENNSRQSPGLYKDDAKAGSSYEFLKSIMG